MIVPNSFYVVVEVSKDVYENTLSGNKEDYKLPHLSVWEGNIYAVGDSGFSNNPVGATKDNQYVFARIPDSMGLKRGDRVIVNTNPQYGLVYENKYLLFTYREGILCVIRNTEEEINLFNQEMAPVATV